MPTTPLELTGFVNQALRHCRTQSSHPYQLKAKPRARPRRAQGINWEPIECHRANIPCEEGANKLFETLSLLRKYIHSNVQRIWTCRKIESRKAPGREKRAYSIEDPRFMAGEIPMAQPTRKPPQSSPVFVFETPSRLVGAIHQAI